jgi:hypothetical protein
VWEKYDDLVAAYEENAAEHVKQWQLACELVDQTEELGIYKDAYVLDAALLGARSKSPMNPERWNLSGLTDRDEC